MTELILVCFGSVHVCLCFFVRAGDGIRELVRSRGVGVGVCVYVCGCVGMTEFNGTCCGSAHAGAYTHLTLPTILRV